MSLEYHSLKSVFNLSQSQYFVIGNPIHHSVSPQMHQAVLDKVGLDHTYGALLINSDDELSSFFTMLRHSSVKGINVTVPYKESVIPFLDVLDDSAKNCQAVNTIVNKVGSLIGYNTDGSGFVYSVKQDLNLSFEDKHVVVIGAGGAAKGIAFELCLHGVSSLSILNRTPEKADSLQYLLEEHFKLPIHTGRLDFQVDSTEWRLLNSADIIIQTTSVGLSTSPGTPISNFTWAHPNQVAIDIIYKPYETSFLRSCSTYGVSTLNGVGMLAGQGALAFKLFTDHEADYLLMRTIVEQTAKDVS